MTSVATQENLDGYVAAVIAWRRVLESRCAHRERNGR